MAGAEVRGSSPGGEPLIYHPLFDERKGHRMEGWTAAFLEMLNLVGVKFISGTNPPNLALGYYATEEVSAVIGKDLENMIWETTAAQRSGHAHGELNAFSLAFQAAVCEAARVLVEGGAITAAEADTLEGLIASTCADSNHRARCPAC